MSTSNFIYTSQYKGESGNIVSGNVHFVIVVAASSIDVARDYVKKQIGIDVTPTWLMGASYPTIYTSDGLKPKEIQAKILYNGNCHY